MDSLTDAALLVADMGRRARAASRKVGRASADARALAIRTAANAVRGQCDEILAANRRDMEFGQTNGLSAAMLDRLMLDQGRVGTIADSLDAIAEQPDPVGATLSEWTRPSGLHIRRVRTPIGVIGVVYESRPNVTTDAGGLALKSGNAVILRGGSESLHSAAALHDCLEAGLAAANLPQDATQLIRTRDRAAVSALLALTESVDVIVPRGGRGLVAAVQEQARVPVFAHLEGIVHVYVDALADPEVARAVVLNAKTRRTGICSAAECLLLHRDIAGEMGVKLVKALVAAGVEVRADETLSRIDGTVPATANDWGHEYLDSIIAARVVEGVDDAIAHINHHGSGHTDCIITRDLDVVARFQERVDSAIVMHNASTQFADGGEFGLGAEIGIATGKLHARGPVGAEQLTSFKYLVTGEGAIRP